MRKNAAILLIACSMLAWMLPSAAQAASSAQNLALARSLNTSLINKLQAADQQPELSPLVNSTYVLLDAFDSALQNNNAGAMQAAVQQYADDVQSFQNAASDSACFGPLALSITSQLSAMYQTVVSGGTPVCMFLIFSTEIADILYATDSYQICVLKASENPDAAAIASFQQQQAALKIYKFSTAVARVALCNQSVGVQDIFNLLLQFISLFITG